jgi:SAM-dependent methyltransferase
MASGPDMGTDRDWEAWGRDDPYYGVLSSEQFRTRTLSDEARSAFFDSGARHIQGVLTVIRESFAPDFAPRQSLDFGCGVGRLLIPLARASDRATGIDVSPSMLAEAARNCAAQGVGNVTLLPSHDRLDGVAAGFDLVHSYIVLQHIPPARGHGLIAALAQRVAPGGFLVLQFPHARTTSWPVNVLTWLRYHFGPANAVRNLLRSRPLREPPMQLHAYDRDRVLRTVQETGFGPPRLLPDRAAGSDFECTLLVARRNAGAG